LFIYFYNMKKVLLNNVADFWLILVKPWFCMNGPKLYQSTIFINDSHEKKERRGLPTPSLFGIIECVA